MSIDDKNASAAPQKARLALVAELFGHDGRVWGLDWSPEGDTLASCGADRTVRTWHCIGNKSRNSASEGRWVPDAVLEESQARAVRAVAWAPARPTAAASSSRIRSRRRRRLAAASFDASVAVWEEERKPPPSSGVDIEDGDDVDIDDVDDDDDEPTLWSQVALLQGHESEVKGVAWSPVPGGAEDTGELSSEEEEGEGEKDERSTLAPPLTNTSTNLLGDGEGCLLATCGRDRSVWIWESVPSSSSSSSMVTGGNPCEFECVDVKQGHSGDVKAVAWHPSGSVLASASYDGTVRLWVPEGGASEAGVAGGAGGTANPAADEWLCAQEVKGAHGGETVWSIVFEPRKKRKKGIVGVRAATCGGDGRVSVWECPLPSGEATTSPSAAAGPTERLSWRPGAVARSANPQPLGGRIRPAYSVDWSRCREWIACGGGDDAVRVFAAPPTTAQEKGGRGKEEEVLELAAEARPPTPCEINCVRWRPCRSKGEPPMLAAACDDGVVRLWKLVKE